MSSVHAASSSSSIVSWQSYRPTYLTEPDPRVLGKIKENLKNCPSIKPDFFDRLEKCDSLLKQALQWEYEKTQNILEGRAQGTIDEASGMTKHFQEQLFKIGEEVTRWDDKNLLKIMSNQDIQNLRNSSLVMGFHHSDPNDPMLSTNDRMPSYEEFVARGIIEEAHEPLPPSSSCNSPSVSNNTMGLIYYKDLRDLHQEYCKYISPSAKRILTDPDKFTYDEQLQICKEVQDWNFQDPYGPDRKTRFSLNARIVKMCNTKIKRRQEGKPFTSPSSVS